MELIRELLNILRKWGYSSTPVLKLSDKEKPPETRKDKVLRDIETCKIKSNDDAAKKYWDGPKAYRNATSALSDYTKELVHAILFLDISSTSTAVKAFRQCSVYLLSGQLLIKVGYRATGCILLDKSLTIARKMDFNEERAIALKYLENHYNQSMGISACKKAFKEYKKVLELINKEAEIRYLYRELNFHTYREMTFSRDIVQKTIETERKADEIFKKYRSFDISLYWYNIKLAIYDIRCEYRQALEYAKQASKYFSKHTRQTRVIPGAYLNEALKYCLYLKDYEQGETLAEQIPDIMPKDSLNRIQGFQYCILFYLHQFNPRKSLNYYQRIKDELIAHSSIQSIDKEKWDLLIFYTGWMLLYYKRVGRIELSKSEIEFSEFFRNNFHTARFPNLSKDKQGWNVAIRVLDALYLITIGQTENLMLKEESLRKYKERYLKEKKRTERSFLIFEVLDEVTKNGLNNTTIKAVEKKLPALKKHQSKTDPTSEHFQEVLPFEVLWEHLRVS